MATQQETDDLAQLLLSASDAEPTEAEIHATTNARASDQESSARSSPVSGEVYQS